MGTGWWIYGSRLLEKSRRTEKKSVFVICEWVDGEKMTPSKSTGQTQKKVMFPDKKPSKQVKSFGTSAAGLSSLITFTVLLLAWISGFASRLFAVIRFESIIHEFDPWYVSESYFLTPFQFCQRVSFPLLLLSSLDFYLHFFFNLESYIFLNFLGLWAFGNLGGGCFCFIKCTWWLSFLLW